MLNCRIAAGHCGRNILDLFLAICLSPPLSTAVLPGYAGLAAGAEGQAGEDAGGVAARRGGR